jgi:adenosylcobinamide-GDP ribazoletransferase
VRSFLGAVAFLTRIPVRAELGADDVARGTLFFPVVGAAVGALAGLAADGLEGPLPALAAGAIGVAVAIVLTGALHVDALADTADALGGRSRAQALEIMRDSRIGSFGAAAVGLALLVESSAVGGLASTGSAWRPFLVAAALARAVSPPLALVLPYAREAPGPGSVLSGRTPWWGAAGAAAIAAGAAVGLEGRDGLVACAVAAGVGAASYAGCRAWLGGVTGDTLGATTQLTEIGCLLTLLALR